MPPMSKKTRRAIIAAVTAFLFFFLLPLFWDVPITGFHSFCYGILLLAWMETLRGRLSNTLIRRRVVPAVFLLFCLPVLRLFRYSIFEEIPDLARALWYIYYIPMITVPLLFFYAALCVDRREEDKPIGKARILWLPAGCLMAAILTNDRHGLALSLGEKGVVHGPVYWIYVCWAATLTFAAYGILLVRCRRSASRNLWYIPILCTLPPLFLLGWYVASGGSPVVFGKKFYNFQEVYALLYFCYWESLIEIGLIPSSADYDAIFRLGSWSAALADMGGRVVYYSKDVGEMTPALIRAAAERPVPVGRGRWIRSRPISGGSVIWTEDLSEIARLNDELLRVNEALSAENAVLEAENEIKQTKARYEAANRLWDGIVDEIRPQLRAIGGLLGDGGVPSDEALADCAFLGAYIKRRSNLSLIAEDAPTLSSEELGLAIRESLSYLSLRGMLCDIREIGSAVLGAEAVELAYEIFEDAAEGSLKEEPGSLLVTLMAAPSRFTMTLLFEDTPPALRSPRLTEERIAAVGAKISSFGEDGAGILRFEVPCAASAEDPGHAPDGGDGKGGAA